MTQGLLLYCVKVIGTYHVGRGGQCVTTIISGPYNEAVLLQTWRILTLCIGIMFYVICTGLDAIGLGFEMVFYGYCHLKYR